MPPGSVLLAEANLGREAVEDVHQLLETDATVVDAEGHGLRDARFHVIAENRQADSVESGFSSRQLLEDFHAEARFLHHPPDSAHLSFNAIQTGDQELLLSCIQHKGMSDNKGWLWLITTVLLNRYSTAPNYLCTLGLRSSILSDTPE